MKKIGIVVAVEIKSFLDRYGEPKETIFHPGFETLIYQDGDYVLYVVSCGAGEIYASGATQFLISTFNVDLIFNYGIVGGLRPELSTCNVCVVDKVTHYAFETDGWLGLKKGQYSLEGDQYFKTTKSLIDLTKEVEPNISVVTCASADRFVDSVSDKEALAKEFNADICDMECAGIVITALKNHVPVLVIKTVADSLTGGHEQFFEEFNKASNACLEILDFVLKKF